MVNGAAGDNAARMKPLSPQQPGFFRREIARKKKLGRFVGPDFFQSLHRLDGNTAGRERPHVACLSSELGLVITGG